MYHMYFIHSMVDGHLGCFQCLAILNKATMNIAVQVSLWYSEASSGYMPKSGMPGS